MAEDRETIVLPLPEIIDGEDWEIRQSPDNRLAYVDFKKREMCVPFNEGGRSELIRAHEAMHVAITPQGKLAKLDGVQNRTMQAVEDTRVNWYLKRAKVDQTHRVWSDKEDEALANNPLLSTLEAARADMATRNTADNPPVRAIIEERYPGLPEAVDKFYEKHFGNPKRLPTWEDTIECSKLLEKEFWDWEPMSMPDMDGGEPSDEPGESIEGGSGGESSSGSPGEGKTSEEKQRVGKKKKEEPGGAKKEEKESEGDSDKDGEGGDKAEGDKKKDGKGGGELPKTSKKRPEPPKDTDVDPRKPFKPGADGSTSTTPVYDPDLGTMTKLEEEEIRKSGIKLNYREDDRYSVESGKMEIEYPPLIVPYKPKKQRKRAAVDSGAIPKNLHRYTSDMRVFGEHRLQNNSTAVLIDVSGSMHLNESDLDFIMEEVPSAIIATYSGSGSTGKLRIIAHDRMKATPAEIKRTAGMGNIIDVPALEWLSKRKEKRKLWISDGVITGVSDSVHLKARLYRKAAADIKKGKIIRVNHLQDLKKDHLLKFKDGEFGMYHAEPQITKHGHDLNGPGCGVCSDPNCSWWANYKRMYLAWMEGKGPMPSGDG